MLAWERQESKLGITYWVLTTGPWRLTVREEEPFTWEVERDGARVGCGFAVSQMWAIETMRQLISETPVDGPPGSPCTRSPRGEG